MKTTEMATVAVLMMVMACRAQDKAPFPERPAPADGLTIEQMDAKIEDLQRQKEALEQKKAEAEQQAERQGQLTDLHNESKDRIKDADEQLATMETEDQPVTPAQHALVDARRKYLGSLKSLSVKILGIKDPKALEQARQVRAEIDEVETVWRVIEEPKLNAARTIEDLAKSLEQDNTQYRREILTKLRQLADQDAESRSQELAILNARREREKGWDKLIQDFNKDQ